MAYIKEWPFYDQFHAGVGVQAGYLNGSAVDGHFNHQIALPRQLNPVWLCLSDQSASESIHVSLGNGLPMGAVTSACIELSAIGSLIFVLFLLLSAPYLSGLRI